MKPNLFAGIVELGDDSVQPSVPTNLEIPGKGRLYLQLVRGGACFGYFQSHMFFIFLSLFL